MASNNNLPTSIIREENFIIGSRSIANVFDDFFSSDAQKVKSKTKFFGKYFSNFLPPNIHKSINLTQVAESEISCEISSEINCSK